MRIVPPRKLSLIAAGIAVTLGLACSDSTAPSLSQRIAGTYALTTDLQSFTYSLSCTGTACTDTTVDAAPSKLDGTFTLVNASGGGSGEMQFTISNASLHEVHCGRGTDPCADGVASLSGAATVAGDSLEFLTTLYGGTVVELHGAVVGDEIRGELVWQTYFGCCAHEYYSGTFVAKRQH